MAGGLYAKMVCQVKGLDHIVEGGRTIVGCASGVGQSMGVDSRDQAVLVSDIGCKLSILGTLTTSTHLPASATVVAALSLSRSVSAATTVGPALLLLWLGSLLLLGELQVRLFVLYSAKLICLRGLATAAAT